MLAKKYDTDLKISASLELSLIFDILQNNLANLKSQILHKKINWDLFYKLTIRHRIWYQVYKALTEVKDMSVPIYERLAKRCQQDKLHLLATMAETKRIAQAFSEQAIPYCFMKGILLNLSIYQAINSRPCKDIDVWVHPNAYGLAMEVLISLGYKKILPTYELTGFQKQYYMSHKHDMTFFHEKLKICVEPHFRLEYFGIAFFPPTVSILKSVQLFNTPVMTLQDDYHLLYLMLHGSIHAWTRLRWLNDIVLYIKSEKCDLQRIRGLARELHCEHIVEQTLMLVQLHFGKYDPKFANLVINPSPQVVQLVKATQQFIEADYELTEDYSIFHPMFFKYRFYLIKLAAPGMKIQALLGDLFKIDNLFPYVKFSKKFSFMYYLLYPLWVVKLIISRQMSKREGNL